ncbi:MAG: 3'-5' exonuclease [Saprospiraceae bacterium]
MDWLTKIWPFGKQWPDTPLWNTYQAAFSEGYTRKTPLREVRFVVLDTETTGLDPMKDNILSIGAVAVENQEIRIADRFEALFPQAAAVSKQEEAIAVHGILQKHSRQQTESSEAILAGFVSYLSNAVMVGHHVSFDFGILNQACQRQLGGKLKNKTVDTIWLAKRVVDAHYMMQTPQQAGTYSLDAMCEQYRIPIQDRHTASGDAMLTALLFVKLVARLEKKGVKTLGDLLRQP